MTLGLPDRLASKFIIRFDRCWIWTAATDRHGYGRVRWEGRTHAAHRLIWQFLRGDIAPGLELDHLCRNRSCVNPNHMEVVTHAENCARSNASAAMTQKYANWVQCPQGHELSGDNLYTFRTRAGYVNKQCRTCRNANKRRRRAELAAIREAG